MSVPPFDFDSFLTNLSDRLRLQFEQARTMAHGPTHGDKVESALRDFLRRHLPARFGVGTGHVVDFQCRQSQQNDVILYDALHCPRLYGEEVDRPDCYPVDGVLGVIQVTDQSLGKKKLADDMGKIESLRELFPTLEMPQHYADARPFGIVFAARSNLKLETLAAVVDRRRNELCSMTVPHHSVNAVVVLGKGIVCYQHPEDARKIGIDPSEVVETEQGPTRWITTHFPFADNTLSWFLVLLLHRLVIQSEALILGRAMRISGWRTRDGAPARCKQVLPYFAAVDAQVPVPSLYSYFQRALRRSAS